MKRAKRRAIAAYAMMSIKDGEISEAKLLDLSPLLIKLVVSNAAKIEKLENQVEELKKQLENK